MKYTVKRIMEKKLMWGIIIIVVTQVLGMLPMLDFLPSWALKLISFVLGVFLSCGKGAEMFFEQSAQLESTTETEYAAHSNDGSKVESRTVTTTAAKIDGDSKQ